MKRTATMRTTTGVTPHGRHLIEGEWGGTGSTFSSEPAHGPAHAFSVGAIDLVARGVPRAHRGRDRGP